MDDTTEIIADILEDMDGLDYVTVATVILETLGLSTGPSGTVS